MKTKIIGEILNRFQREGRPVPRCGGSRCCHYGEGCALGYPLVSELHGFGIGWDGLQKLRRVPLGPLVSEIYGNRFREFWENCKGQPSAPPWILPCCHTGCSFWECQHLQTPWPRTNLHNLNGSQRNRSVVCTIQEKERS